MPEIFEVNKAMLKNGVKMSDQSIDYVSCRSSSETSENSGEEMELPTALIENVGDSEADVPQTGARTVNIWTNDREFENNDEKDKFYKEEETFWRIRKSNVFVEDGRKTFFYCNQAQRRHKECPAKACLFKNEKTNKLILQRNQFEHQHELPQQKPSNETFEKIKEMVDANMKRRKIRQKLYHDDIVNPKPTAPQVFFFKFLYILFYPYL